MKEGVVRIISQTMPHEGTHQQELPIQGNGLPVENGEGIGDEGSFFTKHETLRPRPVRQAKVTRRCLTHEVVAVCATFRKNQSTLKHGAPPTDNHVRGQRTTSLGKILAFLTSSNGPPANCGCHGNSRSNSYACQIRLLQLCDYVYPLEILHADLELGLGGDPDITR